MLAWNSSHLDARGIHQEPPALGNLAGIMGGAGKIAPPGGCEIASAQIGELCSLATVSRPDICARLAWIASRINSLQGAGVYRINDLAKTVKKWQPAAVSKYFSSGKMDQSSSARRRNNERHCKEKIHGNTMTLAGRPDAAYGDQSSLGKRRLSYVIGLTSPNPCGPCHLIQLTSKFTRKLAKSSLGGEVYAFSEMVDHMSMPREFYGHFTDLYSGMAGMEDCESLFTHLKKNKLVAGKFLVRRFLAIQQAIELQESDNVYWIPGKENPAGGLTKLRSEILPLLRLIERGPIILDVCDLPKRRPFGSVNSFPPPPCAPYIYFCGES